jgi:hypothetical protein
MVSVCMVQGRTPLLNACEAGDVESMKLLLAAGASLVTPPNSVICVCMCVRAYANLLHA